MNSFLPSELARLVYGYLKEEGFIHTCDIFLNECQYLAEYAAELQQGREYPTKVVGKSLKEMLAEYGVILFGINSPNTAVQKVWRKLSKVMNQLGVIQVAFSNRTSIELYETSRNDSKSCVYDRNNLTSSANNSVLLESPTQKSIYGKLISSSSVQNVVTNASLISTKEKYVTNSSSPKFFGANLLSKESAIEKSNTILSNVEERDSYGKSNHRLKTTDCDVTTPIISFSTGNTNETSLVNMVQPSSCNTLTPVKLSENFLTSRQLLPAKSDMFTLRETRSPKRKSNAPRRRSYEDKLKESQILGGVLGNSQFAEKLAETINRACSKKTDRDNSDLEPSLTASDGLPANSCNKSTDATASKQHSVEIQKDLVHDDSDLDQIFQGLMTEDEIAEIVNMTRNDPHFETMFGMINAGKHCPNERDYIAEERLKISSKTSRTSEAGISISSKEFLPVVPGCKTTSRLRCKPMKTSGKDANLSPSESMTCFREKLSKHRRTAQPNSPCTITKSEITENNESSIPGVSLKSSDESNILCSGNNLASSSVDSAFVTAASSSNSALFHGIEPCVGSTTYSSVSESINCCKPSHVVSKEVFVRHIDSIAEAHGPVTRIFYPAVEGQLAYSELIEELDSRPCSSSACSPFYESNNLIDGSCSNKNTTSQVCCTDDTNMMLYNDSYCSPSADMDDIDGCKRQLFGKRKVASKKAKNVPKLITTGKRLEDVIDGVIAGASENYTNVLDDNSGSKVSENVPDSNIISTTCLHVPPAVNLTNPTSCTNNNLQTFHALGYSTSPSQLGTTELPSAVLPVLGDGEVNQLKSSLPQLSHSSNIFNSTSFVPSDVITPQIQMEPIVVHNILSPAQSLPFLCLEKQSSADNNFVLAANWPVSNINALSTSDIIASSVQYEIVSPDVHKPVIVVTLPVPQSTIAKQCENKALSTTITSLEASVVTSHEKSKSDKVNKNKALLTASSNLEESVVSSHEKLNNKIHENGALSTGSTGLEEPVVTSCKKFRNNKISSKEKNKSCVKLTNKATITMHTKSKGKKIIVDKNNGSAILSKKSPSNLLTDNTISKNFKALSKRKCKAELTCKRDELVQTGFTADKGGTIVLDDTKVPERFFALLEAVELIRSNDVNEEIKVVTDPVIFNDNFVKFDFKPQTFSTPSVQEVTVFGNLDPTAQVITISQPQLPESSFNTAQCSLRSEKEEQTIVPQKRPLDVDSPQSGSKRPKLFGKNNSQNTCFTNRLKQVDLKSIVEVAHLNQTLEN